MAGSGKESIDILVATIPAQTVVEIEPNLAVEKPIIKQKVTAHFFSSDLSLNQMICVYLKPKTIKAPTTKNKFFISNVNASQSTSLSMLDYYTDPSSNQTIVKPMSNLASGKLFNATSTYLPNLPKLGASGSSSVQYSFPTHAFVAKSNKINAVQAKQAQLPNLFAVPANGLLEARLVAARPTVHNISKMHTKYA